MVVVVHGSVLLLAMLVMFCLAYGRERSVLCAGRVESNVGCGSISFNILQLTKGHFEASGTVDEAAEVGYCFVGGEEIC